MTPQTYIFIGRSGCGKGTQAALLEKILREKTDNHIAHLETGKLFRDFFNGATITQEMAQTIYNNGLLQPEFLTVHLWSDFLVMNMKKETTLIIDGTPRRQNEALVLHTAFEFYHRDSAHVIYINVPRESSHQRMVERKREDDTERDIELRLNWFDTEVLPAIEYYRKNPFYKVHEINGERPIEEVHADIVKTLGLG